MLTKSHTLMGRPAHLKNPVNKIIILERDRVMEFKEICDEKGITVSEGLRQLIEKELEKNAVGQEGNEPNPLNLPMLDSNSTYDIAANKPFEYPTLDQWIEKIKTLNNPQEIGKLQGYHHRAKEVCKMRLEQIKRRSFGL